MERYAIILAAGKGTRMKSKKENISKVGFPILGRPLLKWVLEATKPLNLAKTITVVGFGGETSKIIAEPQSEVVWQKEQKGTGDAVSMASPMLKDKEGITLVCCGDTPLLKTKTLAALFNSHEAHNNVATVLTAFVDDPHGHGRIVKNNGRIEKIVEEKDADLHEKTIHEINTGIYVFDNAHLFKTLSTIASKSDVCHLTDVIRELLKEGKKVSTFTVTDSMEVMSVNDRYQLSVAGQVLRARVNEKWMKAGVSIEDPDSTYISPDATIGADTVIRPNTHIKGRCVIGEDNFLGPDTYLEDVQIGDGNVIEYSHLVETVVKNQTTLGPFLRTRKNAVIGNKAHVGNFNELKNVEFGEGSKCAHLSYLGDAKIGEEVNIGCGSIIANYDGVNKFHSDIGDHAFIGSGTTIISPVVVEDYGFTAAGSTINRDVPAHSMAIARARQENKKGYADTLKEKALAKKEAKK